MNKDRCDERLKSRVEESTYLTSDTMVAPLTPKTTGQPKPSPGSRAPPTIVLCRDEDTVLKKWSLPRYCCVVICILETKIKVGSTTAKAPAPHTQPNIDEAATAPKSHTHLSHECVGRARDPEAIFF